ncbi:MAG: hypothetical protein COA45_04360 [Zetaproteobacteria bacterium]|nr:MAG: hypothetical protein COA45_04360 [Zetaproteobacteria bacterium]
MCNFNINIYSIVRLGFLACIALTFLLPFSVASQAAAGKKATLEETLFSDDKRGCEKKAGMFVLFLNNYKAGKPSGDLLQIKMLAPLSDAAYARIRRDGVEKATLDNMKEYSTCIRNSKPHKNKKKERDLTLKHSACVEFNDILLETLRGIKRRVKPETLMNKYQHNSPDMEWTRYGVIPDATLYYIATLYKNSRTQDYKDVVQAASHISYGCYL